MTPGGQSQAGSFPSGAQVTLTVLVQLRIIPPPPGHYIGRIDINVYRNGITRDSAAVIYLSFDQG
jgi:hypothetical protein